MNSRKEQIINDTYLHTLTDHDNLILRLSNKPFNVNSTKYCRL